MSDDISVPESAGSMIEIDHLQVSYGSETALQDLSLDVPRHSTCAIIGPSGCGKTTLLYVLAGLIRPASGQVCVDGQPLTGIRRQTSLILQEYGLLPWKKVYDNIAFALKSRGLDRMACSAKAQAVMTDLGIADQAGKYPGELSGGQRQRVAIGRALALEPDLLLMDEASSALDAMTREHIQNLILAIYQQRKVTLIVVTHNIEEAVLLGKKIVIMGQGTIRRELDNPCFGLADARDQQAFYDLCRHVRRELYEPS